MHSISHALINGLAGYVLGFEPRIIALLVIAGVVIDLDHFLYYLVTTKKPIRQLFGLGVKHWMCYTPRLFLFHTLEFNVIVLLFGLFVHPFFLYLELAFVIHMMMDVYDYILHLGNIRWAKHWFVTYYVLRYLNRKAREASAAAKRGFAKARVRVAAKRDVFRHKLVAERAKLRLRLREDRARFQARISSQRARFAARVRKVRAKLRSKRVYARSGASE